MRMIEAWRLNGFHSDNEKLAHWYRCDSRLELDTWKPIKTTASRKVSFSAEHHKYSPRRSFGLLVGKTHTRELFILLPTGAFLPASGVSLCAGDSFL